MITKEKTTLLNKVDVWVNRDLSLSISPIFNLDYIIKTWCVKDRGSRYLQNSFDDFNNLEDNKYNYELQNFKLWSDKINQNCKSKYTVNLDTYNNSYNLDNSLDRDLEYCHIEDSNNEYIAIRKHLGGDIRGNYSGYEFYKLKDINYNDYESLFDNFLYNNNCYNNEAGILCDRYSIPFKEVVKPNLDVSFYIDYDLHDYSSTDHLNICMDNKENLDYKCYTLDKMLKDQIIDLDTYNKYELCYNNVDYANLSIILFDYFYDSNKSSEDINQLELFNTNEYKVLKDYDFMPLFVSDNQVFFNGYMIDNTEN